MMVGKNTGGARARARAGSRARGLTMAGACVLPVALLCALACGWWTAGPAVAGDESGDQRTPADDMAAGLAYMERCMFEEAVAAFSRVVRADPRAPEAGRTFDCLGYLYWCRGWNDEALKAFGESLECADGDAGAQVRARLALGQVLLDAGRLAEAGGEFEEALKVVREAGRDEDIDIVYTLMGIARFEAKDSAGAAEMFSRALDAFPENPVAEAYLKTLSFGMPIQIGSVRKALAGEGSGAGTGAGEPIRPPGDAAGAARPLQGVVFINGGAAYATAPQVALALGVTEPVPVKGFFLAAGDEAFRWHDWRSPMIEWRLRGEGDGKKPVRVVYYAAGTPGARGARSVASAEASVVLDREPPRGSVEINDGARYTNRTRITLDLRANDRTSGLLNVSMSNDGVTWSRWTMYQFTKDWEIPPGDGQKKVYVRFRDRAGNISTPVSARIVLDTAPPEILWVDVAKLTDTTAVIVWATDEDSDSAVEYAVARQSDRDALVVRDRDMTMLHDIRLKDLKPSTRYRFRVLSRDEAGNVAASRELEFTTKAANQG